MVSAIDLARRSLVALLKALAKTYGVVLALTPVFFLFALPETPHHRSESSLSEATVSWEFVLGVDNIIPIPNFTKTIHFLVRETPRDIRFTFGFHLNFIYLR
jgi:hypothetical protein